MTQSLGIELVGGVGGLVTSSAILPQIYKCWVTRSTKDLSWAMIFIFYVGVIINLVYGILIHHSAISITACYNLITNTLLGYLKYRYDHASGSESTSMLNTFSTVT
ncbi:hypothetical protein EBT31_21425 [bacterium]|nr:hypothetical protein [bacterium]